MKIKVFYKCNFQDWDNDIISNTRYGVYLNIKKCVYTNNELYDTIIKIYTLFIFGINISLHKVSFRNI